MQTVDVRHVRNIVLLRPIDSMMEFSRSSAAGRASPTARSDDSAYDGDELLAPRWDTRAISSTHFTRAAARIPLGFCCANTNNPLVSGVIPTSMKGGVPEDTGLNESGTACSVPLQPSAVVYFFQGDRRHYPSFSHGGST